MERKDLTHKIYTYSGRLCTIENPPDITDVAVSLSRIARFSGNTLEEFNVLCHSIHVAYILYSRGLHHLLLQGLVHDSTECMFGDIPTPFKNQATRYLEKYAGSRMYAKWGYPFSIIHPAVYHADKISLIMEAKKLLRGDAWLRILDSIEITRADINNIDTDFLDDLVVAYNTKRDAFKPDGAIVTEYIACTESLRKGDAVPKKAFENLMAKVHIEVAK
jgi:hypothetical protein